MAEKDNQQANFCVESKLPGKIFVKRQARKNRTDLEDTVEKGFRKTFPLPETESTLLINLPKELEIKKYPITIRSDIDLTMTYSSKKAEWKINMHPGGLNEAPVTVNITVGTEEPEIPQPDDDPIPEGTTQGGGT